MHRLRNVLQRVHLTSAAPEETVLDVASAMVRGRIGAIPILEDGRLVGIFSERDLMTRVVVAGLDPGATRVGAVMTRDVITATLDDPVHGCLEKMRKASCRHLPVVDGGRLLSVISMRDLLHDELEEQSDEIRSLRAYLHQMPA